MDGLHLMHSPSLVCQVSLWHVSHLCQGPILDRPATFIALTNPSRAGPAFSMGDLSTFFEKALNSLRVGSCLIVLFGLWLIPALGLDVLAILLLIVAKEYSVKLSEVTH